MRNVVLLMSMTCIAAMGGGCEVWTAATSEHPDYNGDGQYGFSDVDYAALREPSFEEQFCEHMKQQDPDYCGKKKKRD